MKIVTEPWYTENLDGTNVIESSNKSRKVYYVS